MGYSVVEGHWKPMATAKAGHLAVQAMLMLFEPVDHLMSRVLCQSAEHLAGREKAMEWVV